MRHADEEIGKALYWTLNDAVDKTFSPTLPELTQYHNLRGHSYGFFQFLTETQHKNGL